MGKEIILGATANEIDGSSFLSDDDLKRKYQEYQLSKKMSARTISEWERDISAFEKWNTESLHKSLCTVSLDDLNEYKQWLQDKLGKPEGTANRYVRSVRVVIRFRDRLDDLTGKVFGSLEVIRFDNCAKAGSGKHYKWICKCLLCGSEKSIRGSDLRSGRITDCGCSAKVKVSNSLSKADQMIGKKFGHLEVLDRDYSMSQGCGRHAWWICKCDLCGRIESISGQRLRSKFEVKDRCSRCCHNSIGEAKICEILADNGLAFSREKTYPTCKNPSTGYNLRFDFCVRDNQTGEDYLIEYDGEQHYHPAPNWDDTYGLEDRKRYDSIKTHWCIDNGVSLIRIPYTRLRTLCIEDLQLSTSQFLVS